jgi:hypothetical protein
MASSSKPVDAKGSRGLSDLEGLADKYRAGSQGNIPLQLSQDAMLLLIQKVQQGERNLSRSILSRTLNVNDVVAEYCLRHLEEKLRDEPAYMDRVITQLNALPDYVREDQLKFLQFAFGVHGMVSRAILDHIRSAAVTP